MQVSETYGIKVSVETEYIALQSNPAQGEFFFAYRISIENRSDYVVQLLRRKWHIADANMQLREIEGDGVVGQQPVIEPGETHTYMSGCQLQSEAGKMWGHYTLERQADQSLMDVTIPEFELVVPWLKN